MKLKTWQFYEMQRLKSFLIISKQVRMNDTQVQSQFSFQTNSPKGKTLYNQNNFSNKRNSFIPQINSDLANPATSDPDLKIIYTLHP